MFSNTFKIYQTFTYPVCRNTLLYNHGSVIMLNLSEPQDLCGSSDSKGKF